MRIFYEADDGSIFDSSEDCEQYEKENIKPMEDILGITSKGDRFTYADEWKYRKSFVEDADAIYFKTKDAIRVFKEKENYDQYCGENGYKEFETGKVYCYDYHYCGFTSLDECISKYQEKLKRLNKYAEEMSKYVNTST